MPVISKRTISSIEDTRFVLKNEQMTRPMSVASNWSFIKLGLLMSFEADWGALPTFFLGLSSNANSYFSSDTGHFVGARTTNIGATRTAGPPDYFNNFTFRAVKKIGRTITENASSISTTLDISSTQTVRNMFFVTILKGSPNFTIQIKSQSSTVQTDSDEDLFKRTLEVEDGTEVSESGVGNASAQTIAVDEATDGFLTNFTFGWSGNRSGKLEVSALGYKIYA